MNGKIKNLINAFESKATLSDKPVEKRSRKSQLACDECKMNLDMKSALIKMDQKMRKMESQNIQMANTMRMMKSNMKGMIEDTKTMTEEMLNMETDIKRMSNFIYRDLAATENFRSRHLLGQMPGQSRDRVKFIEDYWINHPDRLDPDKSKDYVVIKCNIDVQDPVLRDLLNMTGGFGRGRVESLIMSTKKSAATRPYSLRPLCHTFLLSKEPALFVEVKGFVTSSLTGEPNLWISIFETIFDNMVTRDPYGRAHHMAGLSRWPLL